MQYFILTKFFYIHVTGKIELMFYHDNIYHLSFLMQGASSLPD